MKHDETLPPLSDHLSALVRRARDDMGTPREVAELHSRVDRELGPGGGPGGSAPGWAFPMLAAAVVLIGLAGFQVMVGTGAPAAEPTSSRTLSLDEPSAESTAPRLAEASTVEATPAEPVTALVSVPIVTPSIAPTSEAQHEPRRAAPSRDRMRARASPEPAIESPPLEDSERPDPSLANPREETQLLDRARSLLRNDAAAALELTREHERRLRVDR